jgi:hypothetical protein
LLATAGGEKLPLRRRQICRFGRVGKAASFAGSKLEVVVSDKAFQSPIRTVR